MSKLLTPSSVLTEKQEGLALAIHKGKELWEKRDYEGMLNYYQVVHFLFDQSEPFYLREYFINLGIAHQELGFNQEAVDAYMQALLVEGDECEGDKAACHANLSNALLFLNRASESLDFVELAIAYFTASGQKQNLGESLEVQARALSKVGKHDEALNSAKESLDILWSFGLGERTARTLLSCWQAQRES